MDFNFIDKQEKLFLKILISDKSANFVRYRLDGILRFRDFPGVFLEWLFLDFCSKIHTIYMTTSELLDYHNIYIV